MGNQNGWYSHNVRFLNFELTMKPFNLEEYLANPNRKIVTRDGRNVRIICTDRKDSDFPIVALVKNEYAEGERCMCYTKGGKFYTGSDLSDACLFFAPEKHEGWINLYKTAQDYIFPSYIYQTKEDAEKYGIDNDCYITTIKIEWEE